jgi:hypothetical protein
MTPDPYMGISGGSGDSDNPQSWNKYSYTVGDPINAFDPQGTTYCFVSPSTGLTEECYDSVDVNGGSGGTTGGPGGGISVNSALTQKGRGATPPPSSPLPGWWAKQLTRLNCAAQYGQSNSLAALLSPGSQNTFFGNVLGGNTVSSIEGLVSLIFSPNNMNSMTPATALTIVLRGSGQGIPSSSPGVGGAVGQGETALSEIVINAYWNSVTGVTGTITELGLNGQVVSTAAEALSGSTLEGLAAGVGWAKFGFDLGTFLNGYFSHCQ